MEHELSLQETQKKWEGTLQGYIIGFIASLLLTCTSFALVGFELIEPPTVVYVIVGLALVQAITQLIFFLHMGHEMEPSWKTHGFYFMILLLLIIVIGTLWIMTDLHMRVMSYMNHEMMHD